MKKSPLMIFLVSVLGFGAACSQSSKNDSTRRSTTLNEGIIIEGEADRNNELDAISRKPKDEVLQELEEKLGPVEQTSFSELLTSANLRLATTEEMFSRLTMQEYRYVVRDLLGTSHNKISEIDQIIDGFTENNYSGSYKNRSDISITPNIETKRSDFSAIMAKSFKSTNTFKVGCDNQGKCFDFYENELLPKLWRMPLDQDLRDSLGAFYDSYPQTERDEFMLKRVFASPFFHYKQFSPSAGWGQKSYEIGSALSFMITGSLPDSLLMADMKSGDVIHPNIIREHSKRLLDQYPDRFAKMFVSQWLGYAPLLEIGKDDLFKGVRLETILNEPDKIFAELLKQGEDISAFLNLKFNMVNEDLGGIYGVSQSGSQWRSMNVTDTLFGTAYMTYKFTDHKSGNPNPISRGAYVVGNLLCDSVQFPTQDQLEEVDKVLKEADPDLSPPDRMAFFRTKSACKSCHEQIDYHGLALEQIGSFGEFRSEYYTGDKVVVQGKLEGFEFQNSKEFVAKLSQHQKFKSCFIGHAYDYFSGVDKIRTKRDISKQTDLSVLEKLNIKEAIVELVVYAFGGEFL